MRILLVADTVAGVFTYALELSRALRRLGLEVHLATTGALPRADQRRLLAELPGVTVHESRFKLEWMDEPWEEVAAAGDWLLHLSSRVKPDIVHLNDYAHGGRPFGVPTVVTGHSCVLSWWRAVKGEAAPGTYNRYRIEVARGLRGASLVVAPSKAMLASLQRHYGPLPRARVIPHGRDPRPFGPVSKEEIIFSAGRLWDEARNVAAVESVAPRLPWPVFVAGELSKTDGGESGEARHLGRLSGEELIRWYARSSIYALPARYEPSGLTVLEAALSGCALVLGDIESLRETWEGAAEFVPPDDTGALEERLRHVCRSKRRREELAHAARLRALALGPDRMARSYAAAYRELRGQPDAIPQAS